MEIFVLVDTFQMASETAIACLVRKIEFPSHGVGVGLVFTPESDVSGETGETNIDLLAMHADGRFVPCLSEKMFDIESFASCATLRRGRSLRVIAGLGALSTGCLRVWLGGYTSVFVTQSNINFFTNILTGTHATPRLATSTALGSCTRACL
jgi:hypothetical protein